MDPTAVVKRETRFSRKKNQPGGWPPGGAPPDREIPRPPPAPLQTIPARRGAAGAGCFCACDAGGASMRLHAGFTMDPTADRGPDRAPPRSGCRRTAVRRPPLPRPGNSTCSRNAFAALAEAWEAERARGEGRPADRMEGEGGAGDRPDATVRGSGSLRACGARVTHAICKRHRSHIPTQPIQRRYSLLQLIYCNYIPIQNMLLQLFYVDILHVSMLHILISLTPLLCLPPSSHHILNPDPIFPPSHKENT